jgi:signal transduction histidine kinase
MRKNRVSKARGQRNSPGRHWPAEYSAQSQQDSAGEVRRQSQLFLDEGLLHQLYDAVTEIVLILNEKREIVFANQRLLETLKIDEARDIYGARPGDALRCIHVNDNRRGCGSSAFCRACGAVKAIVSSQNGRTDVQECRIVLNEQGDSLELLIRTSPLAVNGENFTICALTDISHEKRKLALERIFIHDIKNLAGGVRFFANLLRNVGPAQVESSAEMIHTTASRLLQEIDVHKDLIAAENNDLTLQSEPIHTLPLLRELAAFYQEQDIGAARRIHVHPDACHACFTSDRTLVTRVLENMLKNALEASSPGDTVTLGARMLKTKVEFWTHNPGFIPEEVQSRIFQRSFSTKGPGRGLGTYGIKLLSEQYLKGSVSFTTSKRYGTTFRVCYPLESRNQERVIVVGARGTDDQTSKVTSQP